MTGYVNCPCCALAMPAADDDIDSSVTCPRTGRSFVVTRSEFRPDGLPEPGPPAVSAPEPKPSLWTTVEDRVAKLNRMLLGWSNYFCLGPVSAAYRAIDRHARHRLRQWLRGKHKLQSRGTTRSPDARLHEEFGLIRLCDRPRTFPWAKA